MRARHPGPGLAVLGCARARGLGAWTRPRRPEERTASGQGSGERGRWRHQAWLGADTVLESVLEASRHQREESAETRSRDRAELPDHRGLSVTSISEAPAPRPSGQGYTDHT